MTIADFISEYHQAEESSGAKMVNSNQKEENLKDKNKPRFTKVFFGKLFLFQKYDPSLYLYYFHMDISQNVMMNLISSI